MERWMPVRKVLAAAITALITAPAVIAYLSGQSDIGPREALAAGVAAVAPVVAAYLTPSAPKSPAGGYSIDPDPGES